MRMPRLAPLVCLWLASTLCLWRNVTLWNLYDDHGHGNAWHDNTRVPFIDYLRTWQATSHKFCSLISLTLARSPTRFPRLAHAHMHALTKNAFKFIHTQAHVHFSASCIVFCVQGRRDPKVSH